MLWNVNIHLDALCAVLYVFASHATSLIHAQEAQLLQQLRGEGHAKVKVMKTSDNFAWMKKKSVLVQQQLPMCKIMNFLLANLILLYKKKHVAP